MGRFIKLLISMLVFIALSVARSVNRGLGVSRLGQCMVLYYHSIRPEDRKRFAEQLDAIVQHAMPLHPARLDSLERGGQYCLVTFDDGFVNFLEMALPELASRNIPTLMFAITRALGKSFGPPSGPEKVMTPQQLRDLPESLVVIGSHTLTHPYLPELNEDHASYEIGESRLELEQLLSKPVRFFSFPFGGMSPRLVTLCQQAGYTQVFSTLPESTSFEKTDYCIGRIRVDPWDWRVEFRLKLAGAYNWLPAAIALKRTFRDLLPDAFGLSGRSVKRGAIRQSVIHN
jgi:peptidoglycan/xylan/chitin deacetylase (PgdA/CDA1 family)